MSKLSLWRTIWLVCVVCAVEVFASPAQTFTTLHSFDGTDGDGLSAGLVQATKGNFYGTTVAGGAIGAGTVFKISAGGKLTTLHNFDGTDGLNPYAAWNHLWLPKNRHLEIGKAHDVATRGGAL